jgi:hypothetical protein
MPGERRRTVWRIDANAGLLVCKRYLLFARAIDAGVILRLQHLLVLLSYPHLTQLYYGWHSARGSAHTVAKDERNRFFLQIANRARE